MAEIYNLPTSSESPPRLIIIGAGSRGNAYAKAVTQSTNGVIVAVAEPVTAKRQALGKRYIWKDGTPQEDQEFDDWEMFLKYERSRQERQAAGEKVLPGFDGVFICTLDHTHAEIITSLSLLGLHIMCEKPLATSLDDCLRIYKALKPAGQAQSSYLFSIGHVLRYSPHNILLRKLVAEDKVIGDVVSIEHTEPVGWWHFSHSYVRGNWRKESTTAPSLLTKSCHDIDLILWLLSPASSSQEEAHQPSHVSSAGSLSYFRRSRKPEAAGNATNCLSCPVEESCLYSAKKIYHERHLSKAKLGWPLKILVPEIEDCVASEGFQAAEKKLMACLSEDYDQSTTQAEIDRRPWFGRCVYESSNDVCDDQLVTMAWDEEASTPRAEVYSGRGAKTASIHMIAFTEKQCERRGRIYGTRGELEYDSETIKVYDFATQATAVHHPQQLGGGHGGGDFGLAEAYVNAIAAVKNKVMGVEAAQRKYIGCTAKDVMRSHAMVFAAEEARTGKKVVDWKMWWEQKVEAVVKE